MGQWDSGIYNYYGCMHAHTHTRGAQFKTTVPLSHCPTSGPCGHEAPGRRLADMKCRVEGCDEPRVRGAVLCQEHLGEKRRCQGRVAVEGGQDGETRQCRRSAVLGLLECPQHGANAPKEVERAHRTRALTAMERFVEPFQGNMDPISAFELEFRRTYGRILWLEGQIAAFEDEKDLIWGKTEETRISASEFPGTNKTYGARIHVYEEMLRWERKHFLELTKIWLRANLDEKKLSMMREHITYTYDKVIEAAKLLGHDPNEDHVRNTLKSLFARELVQ